MTYGCSVGNWSARVQKDAADAWSILIDGDSEVALLTPGGTPGVSHDQVLLAFLLTVADSGDGVILIMAASLVIDDALFVEHEGVAFGIDTDAGWLQGDGGLQLSNFLLWNCFVALEVDLAHVFCGFALAMFTFVRIVGLECDLVLFGILEGPDFETAIAALVFLLRVVAVNKMLLRKFEKVTSVDSV